MFLILQIQVTNVMKETIASQGMSVLASHALQMVSTAGATFYQQHYYQFNYRNRESITIVSLVNLNLRCRSSLVHPIIQHNMVEIEGESVIGHSCLFLNMV